MKKTIIIFLTLIMILSSTAVFADKPTTLEAAVKMANEEIGYPYYELNKVNKKVWGDTGALVYGSPHGEVKKGEYRYLGYTPEGEPFTNYRFPHDDWAGGYLDDRNWIIEPWKDRFCQRQGAFYSDFNNNIYHEQNIKEGLKTYYKNAFKNTFEDWHKYVQILQPPTQYTWGMGRMWHKSDSTGKIWYITVPIAPTSYYQGSAPSPNVEDDEFKKYQFSGFNNYTITYKTGKPHDGRLYSFWLFRPVIAEDNLSDEFLIQIESWTYQGKDYPERQTYPLEHVKIDKNNPFIVLDYNNDFTPMSAVIWRKGKENDLYKDNSTFKKNFWAGYTKQHNGETYYYFDNWLNKADGEMFPTKYWLKHFSNDVIQKFINKYGFTDLEVYEKAIREP